MYWSYNNAIGLHDHRAKWRNAGVNGRPTGGIAAVERTRGVLVLACRTTQEILPKLILAQVRVSIELPGYPGLVVQWEQPDPFTASLLLLSDETPVAQSWFLSDCVATTDSVQVI